jgi:hypothetical protein
MALSFPRKLVEIVALLNEHLFGQPPAGSLFPPTIELWLQRMARDQVLVQLKVSNLTQDRMRITRVSVEGKSFEVWNSLSVQAAQSARRGKEPSFTLEPAQSRLLPVRATKQREEHIDNGDKILVHWLSFQSPKREQPPVELLLTYEEFWAMHDV